MAAAVAVGAGDSVLATASVSVTFSVSAIAVTAGLSAGTAASAAELKTSAVHSAVGTGSPYFTTDTTAALRAAEIGAEALLLAKNTDYVYTADPKVDPNAQPIPEIGYVEVIDRGLSVMDNSALTLCMDNRIPILVFGLKAENSIRRVACGERIGTIIH